MPTVIHVLRCLTYLTMGCRVQTLDGKSSSVVEISQPGRLKAEAEAELNRAIAWC